MDNNTSQVIKTAKMANGKESYINGFDYKCGKCDTKLDKFQNYCSNCGTMALWKVIY